MNIRDQWKLLNTWIILVIGTHHLVQIGRIDEPTEYVSSILAAIQSPERLMAAGRTQSTCRGGEASLTRGNGRFSSRHAGLVNLSALEGLGAPNRNTQKEQD